ncbi:hypothetical protein [Acetobacter sp. LMG 32666]|uniref:hypothetical protein n=1 Tax=Acetobacter sp. LMG 32666 TaxID=2959295 RepID=UPI0030C84C49
MKHRVGLYCVLAGLSALPCGVSGYAVAHGTGSAQQAGAAHAKGDPVALTDQRGSALDSAARVLNADDLAAAARHNDKPLVLVGSAPLSANGANTALFVQVQAASLCGSAGCSTDVYVRRNGAWAKVLDSVSGPIELLPTTHGGVRDILVDGSDRWVWRNNTYVDTLVAQDVPGLKASVQEHQAQMGEQPDGGR